VLHCRHCGTDKTVRRDVVGKLCENCGEATYSPEFERQIEGRPKPPKAAADRTDPFCTSRVRIASSEMNCRDLMWSTSSSATSAANLVQCKSLYSSVVRGFERRAR
jgi:hypothetical protein